MVILYYMVFGRINIEVVSVYDYFSRDRYLVKALILLIFFCNI